MKAHNRKDLTGKVFGILKVIEYEYTDTNRYARWKCLCECGNYKHLTSHDLLSGDYKSCGCRQGTNHGLAHGKSAENSILYRYKLGAKNRNLEWSLYDEQALRLFQLNCYYCGDSPTHSKKISGRGEFIYNGIDRLDNSKGYVEGNVVPCCGVCNFAKRSMPHSKFVSWIIRTADNLNAKVISHA